MLRILKLQQILMQDKSRNLIFALHLPILKKGV
jgi:hypothetical protein